jgi:MFS family permease
VRSASEAKAASKGEAGGGASRGRRVAVSVAGAGVLVAALDAFVVVTILTAIIQDVGVPINRLERATPIITGYLLGYVAAMPLLGQLSDRLGRRAVIHGCLAGFAAGSVVSALAPNLGVLIAGRVLQGAAGGALLPVTFALVGDLWEARTRAVALGAVGASQELGSVLGPLYGAGLAALIGWRGLFWVNVPLAAAAAVAIHRMVPGGRLSKGARPAGVDAVGGALLALGLAAVIAGLYNPDPSTGVLPAWGPWSLAGGVVLLLGFGAWEARSPSRLLDPAGLARGPFVSAMAVSFLAGGALMITLIGIPLYGRALLETDEIGGALLLLRFLVALPVGAVVGGYLAVRFGDRFTGILAMAIAALGYWLVSGWPVDVLGARHGLGLFSVPRLDVDLALAGLGLGLVIAPVTATTLRSSTPDQHGVASAAVVVARMMGMLVGIATAIAWGLHRFRELTANLNLPVEYLDDPEEFERRLAIYDRLLKEAVRIEYREVFLISAGICVVAALSAIALGRASPIRASAPS